MSTAAVATAAPRSLGVRASLSRNRRWALITSYVFLVIFAIFFLIPPVYMVITSLKTSAEISAESNPWWVFHPTLSNYTELLPEILENLGWSHRFATVTYSQEAGVEKPAHGIFALALERAGCSAEAVTVVGDTWEADILGAQAAGLRAIWLDRGESGAEHEGPRIRNLEGILPLLQG